MKTKLILVMILTGLSFSVSAKISCKVLMNSFEKDGKKTVYDLTEKEKGKYKGCLNGMKLMPNSYRNFEDATKAEAERRGKVYKKKEQIVKNKRALKEIAKTREVYSFSGKELEEMLNNPVFAYRFVTRERFTDGMSHKHHAMQRLTDINELCKLIGHENDIKEMRAVEAHMNLSEAQRERDHLNGKGILIHDVVFSSKGYEKFETSKKIRNKMRKKGANKFKILEFSSVTCITNDNKEDTFSDLAPKVTLHTKTKKFTSVLKKEKDEVYVIGDSLEAGNGNRAPANSATRRDEKMSDDAYLNKILDSDVDFKSDVSGFKM